MNTPSEETILTLAAKLGIVAASAAICPTAAGLGVAGGAVVGGILGNAAWEFLKSSTSRLTRRPVPLGEPNHDLNKALARAIATAINEFQSELGESAEDTFRRETNMLGQFTGVEAFQVEDFFKKLRKTKGKNSDSEDILTIVAENAYLKKFLESGDQTEDALPDTLKQDFARDAFPDLPDKVRHWIVENLHRRIAARFWDEVKGDHKAWRAYAAEVFSEYRDRFDTIEDKQDETLTLLRELNSRRDQIVGADYDPAYPEAAKSTAQEIPDDVRDAIISLQTTLLTEIKTLQAKTDTILTEISAVRGQVSRVGQDTKRNLRIGAFTLAGVAVLIGSVVIGISLSEKNRADLIAEQKRIAEEQRAEQNRIAAEQATQQKLDKQRIKGHLVSASEKARDKDLAEAVKAEIAADRIRLRESAEGAHTERLSHIDALAASFADLEKGESRSYVAREVKAILNREDAGSGVVEEALAYLESQRGGVFAAMAARRTANRREAQPFLDGAQLAVTAGKNDEAESLFRQILKADPTWAEAGYQFVLFLHYTRWSRAETHSTIDDANAINEEAHLIAQRLVEDYPENESYLRELAASHSIKGRIAVARGALKMAFDEFEAALKISAILASNDPSNLSRQRDLAVSHLSVGEVAVSRKSWEVAIKHFDEGLQIAEKLVAKDPSHAGWQRDLTSFFVNLGDTANTLGSVKLAIQYYTSGLGVGEDLVKRDSENVDWQYILSIIHYRLGDIALGEEDFKAAYSHLSDSKEIAEKIVLSDPGNMAFQRSLRASYASLGKLAMAQGNLETGITHFREELKMAENLALWDTGNAELQHELVVVHTKLGEIALEQENLEAASEHFGTALEIIKLLASTDSSNEQWQRSLYVSHLKLANLATKNGNDALADKHGRACYQALNGIQERGGYVSPSDLHFLERLEAKLGIESSDK